MMVCADTHAICVNTLALCRAVYNEALKRQNADLAGYLMDTHHVYSILPPSAARPPRGEEFKFLVTLIVCVGTA